MQYYQVAHLLWDFSGKISDREVLLTGIVLLKLKCFASFSWVTPQAGRDPFSLQFTSTSLRPNSLTIPLFFEIGYFKFVVPETVL